MSKDKKISAAIKSITIVIINLLLSIILGVVLLTAAYALPNENVKSNVQKSAITLSEEGVYPSVFSWCQSQLDNFTDAIMLNEAAYEYDASPLEKAIMSFRGGLNGGNPCLVLVDHYVNGIDYTDTVTYSSYWHGYQIFVRPALEFFTYSQIRIINCIVQILLTIIICFLLKKNKLSKYILPYICCYLMLNPIVTGKSFQFSSCYYTFSLGSIALLLMNNEQRKKYSYLVFLNTGIFTAYFDFLTYPIATFGVPALVYLITQKEETLKQKIFGIVKNGIFWCIGFGGMWVSKWLVSYLLLAYDTLSEAISAFKFRTSSSYDEINYSRIECIKNNYRAFSNTIFKYLYLLLSLKLIYEIIKSKAQIKETIITLVPYLLLSLAPIVWYIFATNHSSLHVFIVNRACVVSFMALLFGLTNILIQNKTQKEVNNNG